LDEARCSEDVLLTTLRRSRFFQVLMNTFAPPHASDLTDRQIVYGLFFLRRLAAQGQHATPAHAAELAAALQAARTHAAQAFADPIQRSAALEDADHAAAAVQDLASSPDFEASVAIEKLEALRVLERDNLRQPIGPDAQSTATESVPIAKEEATVLAPPASSKTIPAPSASNPARVPLGKIALVAGLAGALAGFAAGYLTQGTSSPALGAVTGDWRWDGGAKVTLGSDGRFSFNERPAGYFFAATNRDFVLIHGNGRFIDYLSLDAAGNRLSGFSAAGVAVNATRMR
jgi:hypothetical protein